VPSSSSPPSSSVHRARQALADRLREIRLEAGLTSTALAAAAGWHRTKVSKLEYAVTSPSATDIDVWCALCDAQDQAADLLASARAVDSMYVEWRRRQRTGLRRLQESYLPLFEQTTLFRVYQPAVIPGQFQTSEYATMLMRRIIEFEGIPDDTEAAVAARIERQRVLYSGDRRFAVVLEESVLRTSFGGAEVMAGQLDRLMAVASLPRVSLGIIPASVDRGICPMPGFSIYDEHLVQIELPSAELTITQPHEIEVYERTFAALQEMAVYGAAARARILAALEALEK
jgi:transcriptional regulator with XRE-family HTH domain